MGRGGKEGKRGGREEVRKARGGKKDEREKEGVGGK